MKNTLSHAISQSHSRGRSAFARRDGAKIRFQSSLGAVFLFLAFLLPSRLPAQFTSSRATPESLVAEVIKGRGIKVRNVKYVGSADAIARFSNGGPQPTFKDGLILSTGIAAQCSGPNESPKTSTALGALGDRKLDAIANTRTFDASILEFEFMADRDSVSINFIFASEEYAEHVGSTFTDPIIIAVTGPGLGNGKNLALLPGTSTIPVNINSINITENKRWYVDNNPFTLAGKPNPTRKAELDQNVLKSFQYDGMTKSIGVGLQVTPKEVYRMRIAIADAGDGNFDSALLIEAGSLQSIEQYRHVVARLNAQEKRLADSLARVEARQDSLDELETEAAEVVIEEEGDGLTEAPDDTPDEPTDDPMIDENEVEEDEDLLVVDEEEVEDEIAVEEPEEEDELLEEPGAGEDKEYRTVIQFEDDGYFVPEDQEAMLREYGQILKSREDYALGIYIPAAADAQTNELRYDMVRLEVLKAGARPTQVFRMGFSVSSEGAQVPKHRAELLLKAGK